VWVREYIKKKREKERESERERECVYVSVYVYVYVCMATEERRVRKISLGLSCVMHVVAVSD